MNDPQNFAPMPVPVESLRAHVEQFTLARPRFERVADLLVNTLRGLAAPIAPGCEILARAKSVESFAEKVLRKRGRYQQPLLEITDLAGARVVCAFDSQARAVADAIRQTFGGAIDEANSLDQRTRLTASEFGYRSVHYVIQLGPGRALADGTREELWPGLSPDLHGIKVEIQVRTRLQDIWSRLTQGLVYKSPQPLPDAIRREMARIAAEFESLDTDMERVVAEIADYRTHFGALPDEAQLAEERAFCAALREFDPANAAVPLRQAELALALGAWAEAGAHVADFTTKGGVLTPALEAAAGYARCRQTAADPAGPNYTEGLAKLARATERDPRLLVAWLRRAACERTPEEALLCYQRAYRLAPADPATLAGYVHAQLIATRDASFVDLLRPVLRIALDRCERQAALKLDLPWAHFRSAWFRLLLGEGEEESPTEIRPTPRLVSRLNATLRSLLLGLATSRHRLALDEARQFMLTLQERGMARSDGEIALRLLDLGLAVRFGCADAMARFRSAATPRGAPPNSAVLIVAGSAKLSPGEDLAAYERILRGELKAFSGVVIAGGTAQCVPGLVGRIARESAGRIRAVGYVPARFKPTSTSTRSPDYDELRPTAGTHFSSLEPLQAWIDLLAAGVSPAEVRLLGLGGGPIAAFEYRLALVLGASVAVLNDSGRESELLMKDPDWQGGCWRLTGFSRARSGPVA